MSSQDAVEKRPDSEMNDRSASALARLLTKAACIVIISYGIMAASHLLSIVLLALLFAYSLLPLPRWMMRRFRLRRSAALALTVGLLGTLQLALIFLLYAKSTSMRERLPVYQERVKDLYQHATQFLNAHGVHSASLSFAELTASDRLFRYAQLVLPRAGQLFSDGLLVLILGWLFLIAMSKEGDGKGGRIAADLAYYGGDVQPYVAIAARTGALIATANFVLLVAFGVDFPLIWCVLYFFLHFIPNIGVVLAIAPPAFLALIMLGWKTALLVVGGMLLTNTVADYVLTPLFMKKGVHVSFTEIMLSLLGWGYLLGPAGGILAVPLTLALRKFIARSGGGEELTGAAHG